MSRYTSLAICIFFSFYSIDLPAQADTSQQWDSYTDISKIPLVKPLNYKLYEQAYIDAGASLDNYTAINFQKNKRARVAIQNKYVTKKALIKFNVCNTADTSASIWFFPGVYFWNVELYRMEDNRLKKINAIRPDNPDSISYRQIFLPPKDSATLIAVLTPVKTYLNHIHPRFINNVYLTAFIDDFHIEHSAGNHLTYIFCGLLLMMILFSLSNYVQYGNTEFLYYSGYAFFLGLMLFVKATYTFHTSSVAFFQEEYLDFIMQSTGHLFYMAFMMQFLNTRTKHPFLYKLYCFGIGLLIAAMISFTYLHYFSDNFSIENDVENYTKIILLIMVTIFIVYSSTHWKDKLLRYLFWGNLCLFIFSLLSQTIIMSGSLVKNLPVIFKSSLFYYEIGLFLELLFFLAGLNYKNNRQLIADTKERERLKAENKMKEYEKELAVLKAQQEERERISADMHDELGSGMTAIRLMSEIARNKMKGNTPLEIEKISSSADEVLNKMNAIIWSMNSENDTVDNLFSYIRLFALEYFENTAINCKVSIPEKIETTEINGDKRRNIFLCVKETLTNALKHSGASEIKIDFEVDDKLTIRIADNGTGIDIKKIRQFGNGLKNISKRMKSIGGTFHIEKNNGTVTILTLPL